MFALFTRNQLEGLVKSDPSIRKCARDKKSGIQMKTVVIITGLGVWAASGAFAQEPFFVPITPCRMADTRNANGPLGGPALVAQTSRDFAVPTSGCNIPVTVSAYSLNISVVPRGPLGYLTAYPAGQPAPLAATLTSTDGQIRSNASIVAAGTGGAISVFTTDPTDMVIDINGYFVPNNDVIPSNPPTGLGFYPLTP